MEEPSHPSASRDRREFVRTAAIATGAAWTAPTLVSAVVAPAAAQSLILQGTLYGAASNNTITNGATYTVDRDTGAWSRIGSAGTTCLSMTYDGSRDVIYGLNAARNLYRVDRSTGLWTLVGPTGQSGLLGIAYHPVLDALYACGSDGFFTVDRATGAASFVGATGVASPLAMAYDSAAGVLYGTDSITTQLSEIDPSSGGWRGIGSLGVNRIADMAYDSRGAILYGCRLGPQRTFRIDPAGPAATVIGPTGTQRADALAFVP